MGGGRLRADDKTVVSLGQQKAKIRSSRIPEPRLVLDLGGGRL